MKYGFPKLSKTGEQIGFKTMANAVYAGDGRTIEDHLLDIEKPLRNYKLGIMGDGFINNGGNDSATYHTFPDLLQPYFKSVQAYSFVGSTFAYNQNSGENAYAMFELYSWLSSDNDITIVAAGVNDFVYSTPLGDESTKTDGSTLYGGVCMLLNALITSHCLGKEIFMVLPMDSYHPYANITTADHNSLGLTLKDYVDVIRECCEIYSIPTIDLFKEGGIATPYYADRSNNPFTYDGFHLTDLGHKRVFNRIYGKLLSTIVV